MESRASSTRFKLIFASAVIGAILGTILGIRAKENLIGYILLGFLFGLRLGSILIQKDKEEQPHENIKAERKHRQLPEELQDSYYTGLVMRRIMEVYQPRQAQVGENNTEDEEDGDDEEREESVNTYQDNSNYGYTLNDDETSLSFAEIITFPTQIPLTLALLWPVIFLVFGFFFPDKLGSMADLVRLIPVILLPSLILVGLSGVLVLRQGRAVNLFGRILEGSDVYIDGFIKVILGLAGVIYFFFIG